MSLDFLNSELIAARQLEIRGRFHKEQDCVGLAMVGAAGETVAEVWISAANIQDVVDWLEFAHAHLWELGKE